MLAVTMGALPQLDQFWILSPGCHFWDGTFFLMKPRVRKDRG